MITTIHNKVNQQIPKYIFIFNISWYQQLATYLIAASTSQPVSQTFTNALLVPGSSYSLKIVTSLKGTFKAIVAHHSGILVTVTKKHLSLIDNRTVTRPHRPQVFLAQVWVWDQSMSLAQPANWCFPTVKCQHLVILKLVCVIFQLREQDISVISILMPQFTPCHNDKKQLANWLKLAAHQQAVAGEKLTSQ